MRLIITRHGKSEGNIAGIPDGRLPGVLSELGREQAGKLAERLKDEKIDLIVSSDLARAHDTAKVVAEFHPDVELVLDERLRERDIRAAQGKALKDIDWKNPPEDMETKENVENRVFELFEETFKKYSDKTVVFVAHAGINRALIRRIHEGNFDDSLGWKEQRNTCVNVFDIDESGNVKTVLLNCVEHLG